MGEHKSVLGSNILRRLMEERSYLTLDELDDASGTREIVVRVIRKWEARNPRRGNQLMSLDLLLLDEKDNLIRASINHRLIGKFKQDLQEGSIVHIKQFDLGKSNDRFKLTDHKYNMYFTHLSTVNEVSVDAPIIGKSKIRIRNYEHLLNIANTNEELPDVTGKINFILGSNLRDTKSTQKIMANVLMNDGTKVRLSVWDNIAADFRAFLSATERKKRVVIVTAVNPKLFSGELYLNSSSATRFYLTEDLAETKRGNNEKNDNSPMEERELEPDDFSMTTITQMFSFLDDEMPQEKSFYCKAAIVGIETRNGWNYISCSKCYKKLLREDHKLICPHCDDGSVIGIVRFRLEVIVEDGTGRGSFIIFDKDGRKITNTIAAELISIEGPINEKAPIAENENEDCLPSCIEELIGRKFVFEVNIKPFDFQARYRTFTVARIINECFESPKNLVENKVGGSKNKETIMTNKQYARKRKREDKPKDHDEKKATGGRGKRTKHLP